MDGVEAVLKIGIVIRIKFHIEHLMEFMENNDLPNIR